MRRESEVENEDRLYSFPPLLSCVVSLLEQRAVTTRNIEICLITYKQKLPIQFWYMLTFLGSVKLNARLHNMFS